MDNIIPFPKSYGEMTPEEQERWLIAHLNKLMREHSVEELRALNRDVIGREPVFVAVLALFITNQPITEKAILRLIPQIPFD